MSNKFNSFTSDSFAVATRNFYLGLSLFVCAIAGGLHSAGAYAADASMQQVYEAANAGHYGEAQGMMDQVLHDHPGSAKAHFVEAELLAKQGLRARSETELQSAERIDPGLSFARPGAVQELKNLLATPAPQYSNASLAQVHTGSGFSWGLIVTVLCLLAAMGFFLRARRQAQSYVPAGPGGYGPMGPTPYGGPAPYAPGPGYGPMGQMNSGGLGSTIVGGLATGAAVGAGMVAGESLMHHMLDGGRSTGIANNPIPGDDGFQAADNNYDMGGNDFGIDDSSSWDMGSGGGDDWS